VELLELEELELLELAGVPELCCAGAGDDGA
jgi:hypothetical protein